MNGYQTLAVAGVVALTVVTSVLALVETSLTHLGRARAVARDEGENGEAPPDGERLAALLEQRDQVLSPVLLVLLAAQVTLATIIAVAVHDAWGGGWLALAVAVEVVVLFVVAVSAPKTYALRHTEEAAGRIAPLARGLARFAPLRWLASGLASVANLLLPGRGRADGPSVSEEELLALAGEAADEGEIEIDERELIKSIIDFGDTVAREVMVPRLDMVTVGSDFRVEAAMEVAILHGYSRLPAYGEGIDDIVGIVYAKDLMKAERDDQSDRELKGLLRTARFVPETKKVSELLKEMQSEHYHIAIVVDEYGGTAGMVTLEDVIEELVGEIYDEFDVEEPMVEPMSATSVRVNARMPIDEVNELLDAQLPEGDWDSVGGLVYGLLGRVPSEGEAVHSDGYRLQAEKVQGRRIGRVRITRAGAGAALGE